jgi:threonine-phosphate decarboxylase
MRKIPAPYTDPTPLFRHGGAPLRNHGAVLDFSASINPLGPPESVLRVLRSELPNIAHYPDPECRELAERLAELYYLDASQVVVGNGSNELIYAIARAFQPKRVAIVEPTYTEYLRASLLVGANVDHWLADEPNFALHPFDPAGADLVWLCHPNNPTGRGWDEDPLSLDIRAWAQSHPHTIFVVDEAFVPLSWMAPILSHHHPEEQILGLVPLACLLPNVIVLRSLTKPFALPGLRLGFSVSQPDRARLIRSQLAPWSVNALAQRAGLAALDDRQYWRRTEQWLGETIGAPASGAFFKTLHQISLELTPIPSGTNFVLACLEGLTGKELTARLRQRGIVIRDASNFVGLNDRYIRMAIRTPAENLRLFEALEAVLEG